MTSLPLPEHGKFHDLNVPYQDPVSASKKLSMLVQLGYEVVAFSKFMESSPTQGKKKKISIPPPPPKVPINTEMMRYFKKYNTSIMQFSRLTIELREMDDLIKVRDAINLGRYDIIAVVPCNEQLFHQSCNDLNIDIISLDCTSTVSFLLTYTLLSCASKRGICFEICYSPMIRDDSIRNCTVSNAQKLSRVRQFSNLILSSGCMNPMELRGPYDVANLNCLFALPESSYIHTVSKRCREAIVHGFIRKTAKGAIYVQKIPGKRAEQKDSAQQEKRNNFSKKEVKILDEKEKSTEQKENSEENTSNLNEEKKKVEILEQIKKSGSSLLNKKQKKKIKKPLDSVKKENNANDGHAKMVLSPQTDGNDIIISKNTSTKRKKGKKQKNDTKSKEESTNNKPKKGKKRKLDSSSKQPAAKKSAVE